MPSQDANVGVWPCRPPLENLGWVDARGVRPIDDMGMLPWCVTLRIPARAVPLGHIMERDHIPAPDCVIEGCRQKVLDGRGRCHGHPSCAIGRANRPGGT